MKVIRWFAVALLALALSVFFLVRNIGSGLGAMSVHNGNWVTNVSTGSTDAGIMLKATIAIVPYTHLRAHETSLHLVCRLLLERQRR